MHWLFVEERWGWGAREFIQGQCNWGFRSPAPPAVLRAVRMDIGVLCLRISLLLNVAPLLSDEQNHCQLDRVPQAPRWAPVSSGGAGAIGQ